MEQWNNIEIQTPVLRQPKSYHAIDLLKWCWVIQLERFVLIDDPTQLQLKDGQFNDLYSTIELPNKLKPSQYIRDLHKTTRVVARIDMLTNTKELMPKDEYDFKVLNIFQHPPQPPENLDPDVSVDRLLEFLSFLLNEDEKAVDHLLKWITHFIFKPHTRMHHGILLSGNQGTGKSTLGKLVSTLGGKSSRTISPKELKGNFQHWMINSRLVVVEEVKQQRKYDFYNDIKAYFTNDTNRADLKNQTPFDLSNHLHFMMFSNFINPIVIDQDDRRLYYIHSNATKRNKEYYSKLNKYLWDDGGIWVLRKYLKDTYLPKLEDDFPYQIGYRTQDHVNAGIDSRTRLEEIIEEKLEAETELFVSNKWFEFGDLKTDLAHLKLNILNNNSETNSILSSSGLIRERHMIDGKKLDVCWWSKSDSFIRPLFKDTSTEGREKRRKARVFGSYPE